MRPVKGTTGYQSVVEQFISATASIDFHELHEPYLSLIPTAAAQILDLGAGAGRDASILASMGHRVCAVEPMPEFRAAAQSLPNSREIDWIDDSLPALSKLDSCAGRFDFVLASAVWHHLTPVERETAMARISRLIRAGGVFALSLRNGPIGAGTHNFPTDHHQTIKSAVSCGFKLLVAVTDQPSLCAGKAEVSWVKLAFRRC